MTIRLALCSLMLVALAACGSSSSSSPASPSSSSSSSTSGTPVSIVSGATTLTTNAYAPNPITVAVGGSVTWTNNDSITHTSTADGGAWSSGSIAPGGKFTATFSTAGSFKYHCAIHPGMVGTVTVQ